MQIRFLIMVLCLIGISCTTSDEKISRKADRIHDDILSVDTHCDTPMRLLRGGFNPGIRNDKGCIDFPRMKEGRLDAEFFAIFIGQGPRTPEAYEKAHAMTLATFDSIRTSVDRYPELAGIALNEADARNLKAEGRVAIFMGIENGYPVGTDLAKIQQYYDLGARYITLCHSSNNDICDSSTDKGGPEHNGLSPFGEEVVREMNRLGMMVDVSHISDESFYDVLAVTKAPVFASHSSCRALCESPRNLNDDMLQALKRKGRYSDLYTE
jgi:membrane dipeptidase